MSLQVVRVIRGTKESDSDTSPSSTSTMHRKGVERIVNVKAEENTTDTEINRSSDYSDGDTCPTLHNGATGSHRDKTSKDTIAHLPEIPLVLVVEKFSKCCS